MMQENCQEFPSGVPKRAMPIRKGNRDRKTGVLACLGKQASSLFLHLSPWEDRRPRLSRQTGFQPVSYIAIHFDISKNRIISDGDGVYINRLSPLKKSPSHSWQDRYHPRLNDRVDAPAVASSNSNKDFVASFIPRLVSPLVAISALHIEIALKSHGQKGLI